MRGNSQSSVRERVRCRSVTPPLPSDLLRLFHLFPCFFTFTLFSTPPSKHSELSKDDLVDFTTNISAHSQCLLKVLSPSSPYVKPPKNPPIDQTSTTATDNPGRCLDRRERPKAVQIRQRPKSELLIPSSPSCMSRRSGAFFFPTPNSKAPICAPHRSSRLESSHDVFLISFHEKLDS